MAGLSSAMLIAIFPGLDFPSLAWVALIPLLLLLKRCTLRRAFFLSAAVGWCFLCGVTWWGQDIEGYNLFKFFGQNLILCGYFGFFGVTTALLAKKVPRWNTLSVPAVWVLIEYLRSHVGFLSWPFGILGYSQYAVLPVARIAAFTGVYGVSFVIVAVNAALADVVDDLLVRKWALRSAGASALAARKRELSWPVVAQSLLVLLLFIPAVTLKPATAAPAMTSSVVQGNVYLFESNSATLRDEVLRTYERLTLAAGSSQPSLIVWPSSSVPGRIPLERDLVALLGDLARKTGAYLLVGSAGFDKMNGDSLDVNRIANSAFLLSPPGKIVGRYDKIRLLPFDEYLPLRKYVAWPSWIVSDMVDAVPGKELTVFAMDKGRFCVLICWENYFPDQFRKMAAQGVDFMVSMSNDAFVRHSPAAHYHMLALNVFRAIENHVSVIRASTSGVSCVIQPDGLISARVRDDQSRDVNVEGYLAGSIVLGTERSVYNRYGDWFVCALALVMIVVSVQAAFVEKSPSDGECDEQE
jgi:apolipoprotein N-acyltransferase